MASPHITGLRGGSGQWLHAAIKVEIGMDKSRPEEPRLHFPIARPDLSLSIPPALLYSSFSNADSPSSSSSQCRRSATLKGVQWTPRHQGKPLFGFHTPHHPAILIHQTSSFLRALLSSSELIGLIAYIFPRIIGTAAAAVTARRRPRSPKSIVALRVRW